MNHTFAGFIETLEGRRHLASHPLALTPEQEAQVDLGLIAASVAELSGATANAPLSTQPAISTATDIVTALSSPDSLGLLGSSISPMVSGTSIPGNGRITSGSILVGADQVTIDPGLFAG
jgi:hypothetical protein